MRTIIKTHRQNGDTPGGRSHDEALLVPAQAGPALTGGGRKVYTQFALDTACFAPCWGAARFQRYRDELRRRNRD